LLDHNGWLFSDEITPETSALQERMILEGALVPSHWMLEVTNVLAMAERRKRLSAADAAQFVVYLRGLQIEVDDSLFSRAFDHILPLCRTHQLTSYDAAYLDLALRSKLPLASLDDDLRNAAIQLGLAVLGK